MNKIFHIYENKPVVYTYKIYAKTKEDALNKFRSNEDYEEIGLGTGNGKHSITISEIGPALDKCAICNKEYSPNNVRDYRCPACEHERNL